MPKKLKKRKIPISVLEKRFKGCKTMDPELRVAILDRLGDIKKTKDVCCGYISSIGKTPK